MMVTKETKNIEVLIINRRTAGLFVRHKQKPITRAPNITNPSINIAPFEHPFSKSHRTLTIDAPST